MAMILKLAWQPDDLVENNEMINCEERLRCENTTNTMEPVYREVSYHTNIQVLYHIDICTYVLSWDLVLEWGGEC